MYLSILLIVFYIELGSLTQSHLMEKVRALQNMAYHLGMEEGKTVLPHEADHVIHTL